MKKYFSFLIAMMILILMSPFCYADLQVFPLRVVLTEKNRSEQVSLRHTGPKPMQYRISAVYYRMEKDGSMNKIDTPTKDDKFAGELLRFSPKQVVLNPNTEQVVRIMLRLPAQLPDGEYRAHLRFEGVGDADDKLVSTSKNEAGGSMSLKAHMAIAIPILVRKGNVTSNVSFSDLKIKKDATGKPAFSVLMKKTGDASAYGDIQLVNLTKSGKTKIAGEINGISSYIPERILNYPLNGESLESGTLRLIYKKPPSEGGEILTSLETTVP